MQRAAEGGEPIAMANLAVMVAATGDLDAALAWARKAVAAAPLYAHGHRTLGRIALATRRHQDALEAFSRALALDPSCENRVGHGQALAVLGRTADARRDFELCVHDPVLGQSARLELERLGRE
jgi:tetratricopeptide (TPR) repeat protein